MEKRGRPRGFDREVALRRAMEVFWDKGFEAASMTDLTQAMGIASPSLYAAFGSKEALFHEAVALYQACVGGEMWDALEREPAIADAIAAFLVNTARAYSRGTGPRGCLIVLGARHAGVPGDPVSDDLKRRRAQNLARLRARFDRAVAEGELPGDFDCAAAAAFYATLQHGMSLMARDGADAATLEAIAAGGLRAFAGPAFAA
ncbi:TetR/AcrR family transcriptional regulator [Roseomonas hellenica]|uniref:TetR/AcrR family transcriptional regulator n=1 Tax=Plastoroseomonas hellenica TaxID=2687306 RepID=A0ABS5F7W5_9PROT|nr:TetR/AcrR family transcriptional regulator [Plastoroseomonas hellenica]MBR0668611.1 TetR/AcrR family transcriptional regulator [Plastoroseomonas hellenica]